MFSRRHPILFFLLMSLAIFMGGFLLISIITSAILSNTFASPKNIISSSEVVGLVEITDTIIDSCEYIEQLQALVDEKAVKSILIRVDTPGGSVGASQELYAEIIRIKKKKPVIVSMGNMCASGGYYLASAATGIVANPGTMTGSIGVILTTANIEELLQKLGISTSSIKSGEYKDIASFSRPMTPEEKELLQELIDQTNAQFIRAIAKGRDLPVKEVTEIADGRPILGETALGLHLVDRLGNYTDALLWAGKEGGISGMPETVSVAPEPSFWEGMWMTSMSRVINHTFGKVSPGLAYLYAPGQ